MRDVKVTRFNAGIDVGSKHLDVKFAAQYEDGQRKILGSRKFDNTESGFTMLAGWLTQKSKQTETAHIRISCEATGVYHERCCYFLNSLGYYVTIEVPSRVKSYKKSCGFNSKNDKIDATALAYMGLERNLRKWEPVNSFYYELRSLSRYNESVQQMHTSLCNQLHAEQSGMHISTQVVEQLQAAIALFEQQVKAIEKQIEEKMEAEPQIKKKVDAIIKDLKGVDVKTVVTVLAETNGFTWFNNRRQLTKYAGYDVIENQSGKRKGKTKISKKGNAHIRRALYFPALNVVRYKMKPFVEKYKRILERTTIKMKGYTAIQKDLLLLIFTLWKYDRKYDACYKQPNKK